MIKYNISKKADGQMILRDDNDGFENRKKYFIQQGIDIKNVVTTKLCHGISIKKVTQDDRGKIFTETDGLVTNEKDVCLTVTIADCVPVMFWDEKQGVIGIAHAGWRGVVANIAKEVVKKIQQEYSSDPNDIQVFIGPHIQKCHFEIQADIIDNFKDYSEQIIRKDNKIFVDLANILKSQLTQSGVKVKNIQATSDCTYCGSEYFSYRRDKPEQVSSQIAWIINN